MTNDSDLFKDLFVLEIANNHWGSVERGKKIIRAYGELAKKYGIKAAMKFQFRDVDHFIHKDFLATQVDGEAGETPGSHSRYIKKTLATRLSWDEFKELLDESKKWGMHTMTTPFDEVSVEKSKELDIEIMKIGSMNAIAWPLVERIAELKKPTIISNGGTRVADLDRVVLHFEDLSVPLAINHCVSIYPSEDDQNELHQVEFLRRRYPRHVIGFSAHDYNNVPLSHAIAYACGARTFERHIDISYDEPGKSVSPYCLVPEAAEEWFKTHLKAKEMLGSEALTQRAITEKEESYIRSVCRGMYAKRDLPAGYTIGRSRLDEDFYLAIPLQEGQISERDMENDIVLTASVAKDTAVLFTHAR